MSLQTSHPADWTAANRTARERTTQTPWISEDWLSVVIGLFIFVLALAVLANVDLIGWVVTTSVWSNVTLALNTNSKTFVGLGGIGALVATYVALLIVFSGAAVALKSDVKKFALAFTAVFWIAYASWTSATRQFRRGDAGRAAEIRHQLVAQAHQRGRLHLRADRRAADRQLPAGLRRSHQGCGPARTLHQGRDRDFGRLLRGDRGRQAQSCERAAAAWSSGDHRSLSDLLGGGLFRCPQMVWLQPRMGGATGVGHLDLRRIGGDRDRRCDPGTSAGAGAGVVAGGRVRGDRSADPTVPGTDLPVRRAAGGGRLDGAWSRPTAPRSRPAGLPSR
jgi:hypothetical protein